MREAMITPTRINNDPSLFSTFQYDSNTKKRLIDYMRSINPSSAGGYVEDVFQDDIETSIPDVGYEDEEFFWSEQDIYFIEKYNLAVEKDFLDHVINKTRDLAS